MSMDYNVVVGYGFLIPNDIEFLVGVAESTGYKQYADYFDESHFLAETLTQYDLLTYSFIGNYAEGVNEGMLISARSSTIEAEAGCEEELPPMRLKEDGLTVDEKLQLRGAAYEFFGTIDVELGWIVGSYIV